MINVRNEKLLKAVGARLRDLRKAQGLSQEELSYRADLMLSQVARIERGETNPTVSTLYVLANALKVDLQELVSVDLKK